MTPADQPCTVLCDLDGVVWLAHQPIPGAVEGIAALRAAGHRVLFVTNNSAARVEAQEAALAAIGIPAAGDVLTSAMAAALLVQPGERAMVCGGEGVVQALERRGVVVAADGEPVDAVLVGFHRSFDFDGLARAARAVRLGARLIGTNDDATYPTAAGLVPGGGAILASIATATGVTPVVAGKPHAPIVDLVRGRLGATGVMVGDRPDTDGAFARALGYRFALVLTGVTRAADLPVTPAPDVVLPDAATVVRELFPSC